MLGFERKGQTQHKVHALCTPAPNLLAQHQGLQIGKVLQEAKGLLDLQIRAHKPLSEHELEHVLHGSKSPMQCVAYLAPKPQNAAVRLVGSSAYGCHSSMA